MNDTKIPAWAGRSGWWERLRAGERRRVACEIQFRSLATGDPLLTLGEPAMFWVGLVSGLAKFTVKAVSGRSLVYSGIGSGAWFGEGTLMRRGIWRYEAHALRHCELALLPRDTFLWLFERNLSFNHFLLQQLNDRLELMTVQVLDDRLGGSDALVARTLRHLFHPLAGAVGGPLQVTQQEIGQICGLSRQRVNLALQRFEADGVLHLRYGGVEMIDPQKLRQWETRRPESGLEKAIEGHGAEPGLCAKPGNSCPATKVVNLRGATG
jgi:CRP-like cAMP-binding protein